MQPGQITARLRPHAPSALPGLAVVALMLLWAGHNGGYDAETWYWGALATLGLLAASVALLGPRMRLNRERMVVLGLFALYVGWCYLSMAWAQSPGDALAGGNQALLYLLVFALMLLLPWTPQAALVAVLTLAIGIGVIAIVVMFRLASADHVASLVIGGRLGEPTGYFNATAALFTVGALLSIGLGARRELPGLLRGLLLAFGCCGLQLGVIVQSRGWLFTLPIVGLAAILVVHERLRVILTAILPLIGALIPLHRLLHVYQSPHGSALNDAAAAAGQASLLICAGVLVLGTLLAWADSLWPAPTLSQTRRRAVGTAVAVLAAGAFIAGGTIATHGHPLPFISREWNGFSHPQQSFSTQSHFGDVGSERYDFWRVALDAFLAHPLGGLGEDNFANYYLTHRRTYQEPSWTHSIELRLLAQTGLVGFALFAAFMIAALRLAARARRQGAALSRGVAGIALLPLVVWLIHGSLDWFWEIPALSGPALGFLGVAGGLEPAPAAWSARRMAGARTSGAPAWKAQPAAGSGARPRLPRPVAAAGGVLALLVAAAVLGLPYLSVREVSLASNVGSTDPAAALRDLSRAADLNPLSSEPGRMGGAIALQHREYAVAQARFQQAIDRDPGGWFAWLGAGLAASAQGRRPQAHHYFTVADSIDSKQPAVTAALARVDTPRPLTSDEAFKLFEVAH